MKAKNSLSNFFLQLLILEIHSNLELLELNLCPWTLFYTRTWYVKC